MDRPAGLRADLRELPAPAWVLLAGSFVNRFGSFVLPFLTLYMADRGYSTAQAGLALSAYGIGSLSAAAVGGHLADRIGRARTIAASMLSSAAVMLALSQATELSAILPLAGLAGLTSESYRPASSALLTDLVPAGRRLTAFAAYRLAINLGFAAGPAVAGLLAQRSFVLVFAGDAATSAVLGAVALVLLPAHTAPAAAEGEPSPRSGLIRTILADRPFAVLLVATTASAMVYLQQFAALPLQVVADGHSLALFGLLISLNGVVVAAVELPLTSLTRRFPPRPVIAAGAIALGVGYGATGLVSSAPALAATVVVWTLGEILSAPVSAAYVADISPPHMRGRYAGAIGMAFGVAMIAGPPLGTAVYTVSHGLLWAGCLVVSAAAAALLVAAGRDRARAQPPA